MKGHNRSYAGMRGKCQDLVVTQQSGMSVVRGRVFENPSKSPAQSVVRESTRQIAIAFKGCTPLQVRAWKRLGAQMKSKSGKPLSAWQCFLSVWGSLLGLDPTRAILLDAPATVTRPDVFPALTLDVSLVDGATVLTLTAGVPFHFTTVISATDAANVGRTRFGKNDFKRLEIAASLPADPLDLSDAWRAEFGEMLPNQKVAVMLTPLTAEGFQGEPLTLTALTAPAAFPAQAEGEGGTGRAPASLQAA